MSYHVTIPGPPVGKGRPRCSCINGKPRLRTPTTTREWEQAAALLIWASWRGEPIAQPCRVEVIATHPRPSSRPRAVPAEVWRTGRAVCRPSTPDVDNVLKAALDALQLGKVLSDDRWVVEVSGRSVYAAAGQSPSVEILVQEVRW